MGAWLLDFQLGGRVYRYATQAVEVTDLTGRTHRYRAGLSDFALRLTGLNEEQGVEVVDNSVNWALLAARGDGIDRQAATLRYWRDGEVLERARVAVDGLVDTPEYGGPRALGRLVFTVRADLERKLYPPPTAVVDSNTWTNPDTGTGYDPRMEGAVYPTVFGYPGWLVIDGTGYSRIATPALPAFIDGTTASDLLVCIGTIEAATVRIYDASEAGSALPTGSTAEMDVEQISDGIGQVVSVATTSWPGTPNLSADWGRQYYASWRPASGGSWGGGLSVGGGAIRGLTDVLLWALRNSGRKVDLQAQESERDRLDLFNVDGYTNERIDTVEWVEDHLARLFPIVRSYSPRGMYWRAINWGAARTDAIAHLDASINVRRSSAVRTAADQIANRFTLEYALVLNTGTYAARRVISGREVELVGGPAIDDERVTLVPDCVRSDSKYGERERSAVKTGLVWENATADRILQTWAQRDAFPRRFVSYVGTDLARFRRGDVVTITDAELALDQAVALVDAVVLSGRTLQQIDLEILDLRFRSTV